MDRDAPLKARLEQRCGEGGDPLSGDRDLREQLVNAQIFEAVGR
jgi:hypothetical protein